MKIPTYLEGFIKDYEEDGLSRMALCSSAGNGQLEVWYSGDLPDPGSEITGEVPVLLVAKDPKTGEEIMIFDEARHGYDGLFCNEYSPELLENRPLKRFDHPASTLVLELGYGIPYEEEKDEYEIDEEGNVTLINGSKMSWENIKRNGFDYLAFYCVKNGGEEVLIAEFELA